MATDLTRIGEKARQDKNLVFISLYHHVYDVDNLRACYDALDGRKATGVDGVTKADYGANLESNLADLRRRLAGMAYHPCLKHRVYIPRVGSSKKRPLGISCFEDKIVELAFKRVLEPLYEPLFEDSSYGYRPGRSQHQCLDALGRTIQQKRVNHIVEADIRGFFDRVDHDWLERMLKERIGDSRIIRVIHRMIKAGILDDGLEKASTEGTPQGSILSPLLSSVQRKSAGEAYYFRFADDFIACFQYQADAERFLSVLGERLGKFSLELAEEKTQRIAFGRFAKGNAERKGDRASTFTFLGFDHYCGQTRNGHFKLKRRTCKKKFRHGLRCFTEWACKSRSTLTKGEMLRSARRRVAGHLNYYAVTDNLPLSSTFVYHATQILFKWA